MIEIFNLSYLGHLGGINDIFDLSINDRIIFLDILNKTMKAKADNDNQPTI